MNKLMHKHKKKSFKTCFKAEIIMQNKTEIIA